MHELSLPRLYIMRAAYLLIVVGMGMQVWPEIISPAKPWGLMQGVVQCMLGALTLLSLWGVFQPVRMIPVLLFELVWKSIWLLVVALPKWQAGTMDDGTAGTAFACLLGVVFIIAIPWPYVWSHYLRGPVDRWR
jgi:hypothetical protein